MWPCNPRSEETESSCKEALVGPFPKRVWVGSGKSGLYITLLLILKKNLTRSAVDSAAGWTDLVDTVMVDTQNTLTSCSSHLDEIRSRGEMCCCGQNCKPTVMPQSMTEHNRNIHDHDDDDVRG